MKFFAILLFILSLGTSAYGQNLHMIEMSTDNSALGALNFSESGGGGRSKSSDTNIFSVEIMPIKFQSESSWVDRLPILTQTVIMSLIHFSRVRSTI